MRKLLTVDSNRRLTADAAMKNCWLNGFAAKTNTLAETVERIKTFNLQRREKANDPHLDVMSINPDEKKRFLQFVLRPKNEPVVGL